MHRLSEQIHPPDPADLISPVAQHPQIPGQGRTVTAHIDNPLRRHPKHGSQAGLIASLSGRIHHNYIGPDSLPLIFFGKHLLRPSQKELRIANSVPVSVPACVLYGLGNHLHTVYTLCSLSQKQGNRSYPAVEIPDRLRSGKLRIFQRKGVKPFHLGRVHLIKRQRRYGKTDLLAGKPERMNRIPHMDHVRDSVLSPDRVNLASHDHICIFRINAHGNAGHPRNGRKAPCQPLLCGKTALRPPGSFFSGYGIFPAPAALPVLSLRLSAPPVDHQTHHQLAG